MKTEIISTIEKTSNNKIKVVFVNAFDATLNRPSVVPFGAWATIANENSVIIIKESRSKSREYAQQDIGYNIWNPSYKEHYEVSNSQYNQLFGSGNWEKVWMEFDEFQRWKANRNLIIDENANKRQESSWKSTGHR